MSSAAIVPRGRQRERRSKQGGSNVQQAALILNYVRVSTDEQAVHGFSLEGQTAKLADEAGRRGLPCEALVDNRSAKDLKRPVLAAALARLADPDDPASALMVTRLDRLSRSTPDFYDLMDRAAREGWNLICLEPAVDMSTPFGRAMAGMAAVFAQLERELIAQRQRDSVAIRKSKGIYRNRQPLVDPDVAASIVRMRGARLSYRQISEQLMMEGHVPANGGASWHHATLAQIVERATLPNP